MRAKPMKFVRNNVLWIIYFSFAAYAMASHNREPLFLSEGPYSAGKPIVWLILLSFLAYSLYCHKHENFFKSIPKLQPSLWFRQISLDLYLGLLVPLTLIFLDQGLVLMLIWFVPTLLMANLASLLYLALNYQILVSNFVS